MQVLLNVRRKSTQGWSIQNVLLDLTGGLLSASQLVLQCAVTSDWTQIAGNPVKFGLGFVSILFDLVFITQHYVLYAGAGATEEPRHAAESLEAGGSAPGGAPLLEVPGGGSDGVAPAGQGPVTGRDEDALLDES